MSDDLMPGTHQQQEQREQDSKARCFHNLVRIGQAIQQYRREQHGQDPPGALTAEQLGLPPNGAIERCLSASLPDPEAFRCQNDKYRSEGGRPLDVSYQIVWLGGEEADDRQPAFSQLVAQYGWQTPLLIDADHNPPLEPQAPEPAFWTVLVLELSGQVRWRQVPYRMPPWKW